MSRLDNLIVIKRRVMHKYIDLYGLSDARTIKKSQELDKLMAVKQRRLLWKRNAECSNVCAVR